MSDEVEIRAPAEQTEGTRSQILRWLKSVGDTVAENEPLIEIETDKVTVEVASPGSGTLREIVKQEQEEIGPGDLLGRIEATGVSVAAGVSQTADAQNGSDAAIAGAPGLARHAQAADTGSPALGQGAGVSAAVAASAPAAVSAPARAPAGASAAAGASTREALAAAGASATAARNLSPAVRRLLAERGLDASQVRGTGQGGRITVEDILAHDATGASAGATAPDGAAKSANGMGAHAGATAAAADAAAADATRASVAGPTRRVPHTATRKRIAEHMVQSLLHTAPHVTTVFEADLTVVLEHRQRHKDDFARRGASLTLTAYFLQAAVAAIQAVPEANSRWTDTALEIFDSMHIGVATALDTGLVVPVLRDVQSRDLFETAKGLEDLVTRARDGRLAPTDVRGGTFTISNHGVSGSLVATPIIINQPQAAILGIGKLEKRPVVVSDGGEDHIVIRPRCYVTLTIDHRVMDGHQANRFLQTFVGRLATSPG
jgi:2-oxoglutarate dehydrogenase E2 component (dihydrolipoamide succinyltransferase)